MPKLSYYLSVLLLVTSCGGSGTFSVLDGNADSLRYATNLSITRHEGWTQVNLRNPWDTATVLHSYLLVPAEAPVEETNCCEVQDVNLEDLTEEESDT